MTAQETNARHQCERRIAEIEDLLNDELHGRAAKGVDPELSPSQHAALVDEAERLLAMHQSEGLTLTPDQKRQASEQLAFVQAEVAQATPAELLRRVHDARARGDSVELSLIGMFTSDPYVRSLATQAPRVGELRDACSRIRGLWAGLHTHDQQAWTEARRTAEARDVEERARVLHAEQLRAAF